MLIGDVMSHRQPLNCSFNMRLEVKRLNAGFDQIA